MKEKFSLNFFNLSALLTFIIAYVIPCRQSGNISKVFGYPFGWFTVYNDRVGTVLLTSTSVNLIYLIK